VVDLSERITMEGVIKALTEQQKLAKVESVTDLELKWDLLFSAEDHRNRVNIICKRCSTTILQPNSAEATTSQQLQIELQSPLSGCGWLVTDQFDFDNVSVSSLIPPSLWRIEVEDQKKEKEEEEEEETVSLSSKVPSRYLFCVECDGIPIGCVYSPPVSDESNDRDQRFFVSHNRVAYQR